MWLIFEHHPHYCKTALKNNLAFDCFIFQESPNSIVLCEQDCIYSEKFGCGGGGKQ